MVRFVIIGVVIAVAFTLYALVDAAMTDGSRARGVGKPLWILIVVLLPVIGGVLWFVIGKGSAPVRRPAAPDDDPRFTGTKLSSSDLDVHMRDLEDRLRELDNETFPGEDVPRKPAAPTPGIDASGNTGAATGGAGATGSANAAGGVGATGGANAAGTADATGGEGPATGDASDGDPGSDPGNGTGTGTDRRDGGTAQQ